MGRALWDSGIAQWCSTKFHCTIKHQSTGNLYTENKKDNWQHHVFSRMVHLVSL